VEDLESSTMEGPASFFYAMRCNSQMWGIAEMGFIGISFKRSIEIASCLFAMLVLLSVACQGADTKTAYTRDGINFVSKERMEENLRYEYAKPGDYREVQVPLTTAVVDASVIPEIVPDNTSEEATIEEETRQSNSSQNAAQAPKESGRYPYASVGIGLLIAGGVIVFAASGIHGRGRQ
jgi:hypothetical protein